MIGSTVSHYKILEKLGGGGMGVVYKAEDTKLQRTVALKFLPTAFSFDEEAKKRFMLEGQAASALQHNNICTIHDFGETEDGQSFIVMDYYEGKTLKEKLKLGNISLDEFYKIAIQIADGIAKAHENGIIHRDIKPANILITKDGTVKILDFGLAKLAGQTMATKSGATLGTVAYMSPEQALGEEVDHRTDIWSLGMIMYEMIAGQLPFQNEYEQVLIYSILNKDIPPISTLKPEIDDELETLIMDCLIKDKTERFQSAAEVQRKLKNLSGAAKANLKKSIFPKNKSRSRLKRRLKWLAASLASIILMAVILALILQSLMQKEIDLSKYKFTTIAAEAEMERDAIWSPEGKSIAYEKVINGSSQIFLRNLENHLPVQVTFLENKGASNPFWSPDGNLIYFISDISLYSIGLTGGEPKKILDSAYAATISPDGKTIAYWKYEKIVNDSLKQIIKYKSPVFIYSLINKTTRRYSPAPFEEADCFGRTTIKFSPDGKKIALSIYGSACKIAELWILPWPAQDEIKPYKVFEALKAQDSPHFSWFPDSRNMFIHSPSGLYYDYLFIGDTETDEMKCIYAPLKGERCWGEVSPDGNRIALTRRLGNLNIAEIFLDGSPPNMMINTSQDDCSLSFSSDGKKSVYITDKNGNYEIWLRDNNGDIRPIVTKKDFNGAENVAILNANMSPDGSRVAFRVGSKELGSLIYIVSTIGGNPTRLLEGNQFENIGSWSSEGKYLAVGINDNISIVHVGVQEPPKILSNANDYTSWINWSPDGKWLSYLNNKNIVFLSTDGTEKRLLENPIPNITFSRILVWTKDGKSIYLVSTHNGMLSIYNINAESARNKLITEYPSDLVISGYNWASAFGCLSPDGKSVITTTWDSKSDIWIWEGFPQP